MAHFESISLKVLKFVSVFILLRVVCCCSLCRKVYLCSIVLPLLLCQRPTDYIYWGLFLARLFLPLIYICISVYLLIYLNRYILPVPVLITIAVSYILKSGSVSYRIFSLWDCILSFLIDCSLSVL